MSDDEAVTRLLFIAEAYKTREIGAAELEKRITEVVKGRKRIPKPREPYRRRT